MCYFFWFGVGFIYCGFFILVWGFDGFWCWVSCGWCEGRKLSFGLGVLCWWICVKGVGVSVCGFSGLVGGWVCGWMWGFGFSCCCFKVVLGVFGVWFLSGVFGGCWWNDSFMRERR